MNESKFNRFKEKIRYKLDNFMTRNSIAQIFGLGVISFIIIIIGGTIALALVKMGIDTETFKDLDYAPTDFFSALWWAFLRVIDPGTIGGDDVFLTPYFKALSLFITFGGLIVFALLIGILSTKFENKLEELKKGKTRVLEKNHTLILGWSNKIFAIIEEIVEANSNQKKSVIVILSLISKEEMQDAVDEKIFDFQTTEVVYRTGDPTNPFDLLKVGLNEAKSIIILSDDSSSERRLFSDNRAIKSVLAITNNPERREEKFNIAVEIFDRDNYEIVKMIGKDEVEVILSMDMIGKMMVQTSRFVGLSVVYNEILSFQGDEIYFIEFPETYNKEFKEIFDKFDEGVPLGIETKEGKILLNPPKDTIVKEGDKIMALAEDDDTCIYTGAKAQILEESVKEVTERVKQKTENILILGWNDEIISIIREYDTYVFKGTVVQIVSPVSKDYTEKIIEQKLSDVENCIIKYKEANYTVRSELANIDPTKYESIVILSDDTFGLDPENSDANTIIALLILRDILEKSGGKGSIRTVSEILNPKNRILTEITKVNDFIISNELISKILAQISEEKSINNLYKDLFSYSGSEIYLKDVGYYVKTGVKTNFHTVMHQTIKRNEIAFGYKLRRLELDKTKNYGITLNPPKSEEIIFEEGDKIIVIAIDEY